MSVKPFSLLAALGNGHKFEKAASSLLSEIFRRTKSRKASFSQWVLTGAGRRSGKEFELDFLILYGDPYFVYFGGGKQKEAILNFEVTLAGIDKDPAYVADKCSFLAQILDGDATKVVGRLRMKRPYDEMPGLTTVPVAYLGLVAPNAPSLPDPVETLKKLHGLNTKYGLRRDGDRFVVATPMGNEIYVGILPLNKTVEIAYIHNALDKQTRMEDVEERFLFDITRLLGPPLLLRQPPSAYAVDNYSPPRSINIAGKPVNMIKFSIKPDLLAKACYVPRLIDDTEFIQRLPNGKHLEKMAKTVDSGGVFPTPVIIALTDTTEFSPIGEGYIAKEKTQGHAPVFKWQIIDGQHRCFSYYLTTLGNPPSLDVIAYMLIQGSPINEIAGRIFFDVNFRGLKPAADLALAHYAYCSSWPTGWQKKTDEPVAYSGRVLATRFLYELSSSKYYDGLFRAPGYAAPAKLPVSSISTYLAPVFEFGPSGAGHSCIVERHYGATGLKLFAFPPSPTPEDLSKLGFYRKLVEDFCSFSAILEPDNSKLATLYNKQNNVFTALFMFFSEYRLSRGLPLDSLNAASQKQLVSVASMLYELDKDSLLAGKASVYRSGSGWKRLLTEMKDRFKSLGPASL